VEGGCRTAGSTTAPSTPATPGVAIAGGAAAPAPAAPRAPATAPLVLAPLPAAAMTPAFPTIFELLIAPPARLTADVNRLGRELPLQLGDLLMETLLKGAAENQLPIDGEVVAALATDRPLALVQIQRGAGGPPGYCLAAPLARPADAARTAAKLGAPLSERAGAVERRTATGVKLWTGVSEGTLLLARSYDELWSVGARALAATRVALPLEEIVMTLDPDAALVATGSSWASLAADLRKPTRADNQPERPLAPRGRASASRAAAPASPAATPDAQAKALLTRLGDQLIQLFSQTARARLALTVSATDGLVASAALEPKPGTALAQISGAAPAFAVDAQLPIRDDRTGLTAWGGMGLMVPLLRALLPPGSTHHAGPGAPERGPVDDFLNAFSGGGSCTFELGDSPPSSVCSLPIRPGVDARAALESYRALVTAVLAWESSTGVTARKPPPKIRKDVLEFERPLAASAMASDKYATIRTFMGGDSMKYAAAVRGDHLLQFQGGAPRARLAAWVERPTTTSPTAARPEVLSHALARMHGYAAMVLFDPLVPLFKMLEHATDPQSRQAAIMLGALPGLATTRTPLILAAPGGQNLAAELHIPVVTFDNIAKLIRPFVGIMGASRGEPPGPAPTVH
jgi:hypothetical protein